MKKKLAGNLVHAISLFTTLWSILSMLKAVEDIFQSLNQSQISRNYFFQGYSCKPEKTRMTVPRFIFWLYLLLGSFIYILDSSNSSSFTFWSSQFASSSRSNWTVIWTGSSNGSSEISVKDILFFMYHNKHIMKWCWNDDEILLNYTVNNYSPL
jgi:hypothetical protein